MELFLLSCPHNRTKLRIFSLILSSNGRTTDMLRTIPYGYRVWIEAAKFYNYRLSTKSSLGVMWIGKLTDRGRCVSRISIYRGVFFPKIRDGGQAEKQFCFLL